MAGKFDVRYRTADPTVFGRVEGVQGTWQLDLLKKRVADELGVPSGRVILFKCDATKKPAVKDGGPLVDPDAEVGSLDLGGYIYVELTAVPPPPNTGPGTGSSSSAAAGGAIDVEALASSVKKMLLPAIQEAVNEAVNEAKRPISKEMEAICASSVVSLLDNDGDGVGCAIFISPTVAVTCYHVIQGYEDELIHGLLEDGTRLTFRVRHCHEEEKVLDVVALDVDTDGRTTKPFLELNLSPLARGTEVAILSFQSRIQEHVDDSFIVSIGYVKGSVYKTSARHVLLQAPTFRGDSGAAVMLQDGKVVAMNVAGINAAKDRLKALEEIQSGTRMERRVAAMEESVDSLVEDLAQGSLAVLASTFAHFVSPPQGGSDSGTGAGSSGSGSSLAATASGSRSGKDGKGHA